MPETVRVFISSPGDVADERALARQVLNRLRKKHRYKGRLQIEEVSWDDQENPFTFDAHYSFQQAIDLDLAKPSECDVVVVILWSRLGSPLSEDYRKPDGRIYRSGTEWEYLDGLSNPQTRVWVFYRTETVTYRDDDPAFVAKVAQRQAVKEFIGELNDATGANQHGYNGYPSPSDFARLFEDALGEWLDRRLDSVAVVPPAAEVTSPQIGGGDDPLWEGNPYRGLESFGAKHAPIFFGRGPETDALISRVRDGARVLAVIGASGSGKSSLVAAGLLPRLTAGAVPGSKSWVMVRFTPAERGDNPFRALALALSPLLPAGSPDSSHIATRLATEPGYIDSLANSLLDGKPGHAELLLFADQFEELFTARVDQKYRAPFVALLEVAAAARRLRWVLSLRADYFPHCTEYAGLAALLRDGSFPLAAPDVRALTEMVEGPARAAGLDVEPGLVAAIAIDAGDGPGRLALVEFALENLYDLRRGSTLSLAAFNDDLKGIAGLIQRQGDQAVQGASEAVRHELFDALSEVDAKGGAVRKRAFLDELSKEASDLADRLVKARLLTADHDRESGRRWVEVAHEAVLRNWPLFSEWLRNFGALELWHQSLDEARWEGNPYRGLKSFGAEHAPIFFGRRPETVALISRVRDGARVLAVIGASGSGKSSLVAAGLLPWLAAGAVPGSKSWVMVRFTPAERGDNPFRALALALSPLLPAGSPDSSHIATRLATEPGYIDSLANSLLDGKPGHAELLLFADQFEELFTARVDQKYRAPFVALVEAVATARRVRLVLSLRADYYPYCTDYPELAALLRDGSFPLAAPDVRALTEMVEGPARAAGLAVESGLVAEIAKDAGDGPGRLALVEYALEKLYDLRRGNTLSLAAYRDEYKGIAGLIQRQGDEAAQGASVAARHELFDALSEVDAKGGAVRKRAYRADLSEPAQALVERLEDARLLTADQDPETGRPWVEVAHEAVLRNWPLFSDWLRDYGAFKLWRQGLDAARQRWLDTGQKSDHLLSGGPLKEALLKQRERPEQLTDEQTTFISRSRRRNWIIKAKVTALALLTGLLMSWGGNAWVQWLETRPVIPEMVEIPAGNFCMGSRLPDTPAPAECPELPEDDEADPDETPARRVSVPAFRLGKHEVTAAEYRRFVKAMKAKGKELIWNDEPNTVNALPLDQRDQKDRLPAVNVSFEDARAYAVWLSVATGQPEKTPYRLPTEAEWEYAARAGTKTLRWWGDDLKHRDGCIHANVLDGQALSELKAGGTVITGKGFACETDGYVWSAPVGHFGVPGANKFGLQDMLGNVWEWVRDCYHDSYQGAKDHTARVNNSDDTACQSGRRVGRGGSWLSEARGVRSADRLGNEPTGRDNDLGFRLAQDLK